MNTTHSVLAVVASAARERNDASLKLQRAVQQAAELGVSQREIARTLGVTQSAVSQMLAVTRSRSQLARGPVGRALLEHRDQVIEVAQAHGAVKVRVFGSVARGRDTDDSDVDLLVMMAAESGMLDVAKLGDELASVLGVPVDVVPEHMVKREALPALRREAVAL